MPEFMKNTNFCQNPPMDRHESKAEEERNGWGRVKTYQPGRLLMKNVRVLGENMAIWFEIRKNVQL